MKLVVLFVSACLLLSACGEIQLHSSSEEVFSAREVASETVNEMLDASSSAYSIASTETGVDNYQFSPNAVLLNSYTVEHPYLCRIDFEEDGGGKMLNLVFQVLDWNALSFDQRGEIAVDAIRFAVGFIETNEIEDESTTCYGSLENGDTLFNVTDGIWMIVVRDVGPGEYEYDEEDIYWWEGI